MENKPPQPKAAKIELVYAHPFDLHRIWRGLRTGNWSMVIPLEI